MWKFKLGGAAIYIAYHQRNRFLVPSRIFATVVHHGGKGARVTISPETKTSLGSAEVMSGTFVSTFVAGNAAAWYGLERMKVPLAEFLRG